MKFYYFDVLKEYDYQLSGKSVFTTSAHLIKALNVSLDRILMRGVPFIIDLCKSNSEFLRQSLLFDFERFRKDEGNAVTVFKYSKSIELVKQCYNRDVVVGSGVRELRDTTFRIATFGWALSVASLTEACNTIREVAKTL